MIEESTAHSSQCYEPQHENLHQRSISFQFSLQILTREGFSVKGEAIMDKTSTVPPRTSQQPVPTIDQEYDDDSVTQTPRSALRHRAIHSQPPAAQTPNTGPIVAPVITHRVSGPTRALLYLLLVCCLAFLFNGIVWPALVNFDNHLKYGDAQISTYIINGKSFIAQDDNNVVKILITSENNTHNQILTTIVRGTGSHALVTLSEDGNNVDVSVAGTYVTSLVPDTHGGYTWKEA